jgi:hypothetical protein
MLKKPLLIFLGALSVFLTALSIGFAGSPTMVAKPSGVQRQAPLQSDSLVAVAGMGKSTDKQYVVDLRRCASMAGADKASCIAFARRRHGDA